jgi:hypothetical protein
MTVANKRLLISESHGDSNRYTPYRRKPNQHDTYDSHVSPRTPGVHFLREVPVRANLLWVINRVGRMHCSWLNLSARLSGPRDPPQFLSQHIHWSSALKPSSYWRQATRLIGLISPVCNRYVQYLLMGTNPSVLNRHRQGLLHRILGIPTTLSPPFPSKCSTSPPK